MNDPAYLWVGTIVWFLGWLGYAWETTDSELGFRKRWSETMRIYRGMTMGPDHLDGWTRGKVFILRLISGFVFVVGNMENHTVSAMFVFLVIWIFSQWLESPATWFQPFREYIVDRSPRADSREAALPTAVATQSTVVQAHSAQLSTSAPCNVCGDRLGNSIVYCEGCGTPCHGDCWDYVGRCSVYGCSEIINSKTPPNPDRRWNSTWRVIDLIRRRFG